MKASTHLRKIIRDMVLKGFIIEVHETHWNGKPKVVYMANFSKLERDCKEWYENTLIMLGQPYRLSGFDGI